MSYSLKECGLTPKRIELLNKANIFNSDDLFSYYPYRYDVLESVPYKDWKVNDKVIFEGILISKPATYKYRGNRSVSRFNVLSEDDVINVTIYNRHWVSQLKLEQKLVIIGKYEGNNKVTASNYYGKPIDEFLGINPIYPLVDKLTQKNVNDSIKKAFNKLKDKIENIIPNEFIIRYRLLNKKDAIRMIHFPKSYNEIRLALRTLKYEEFLKFNVAINLIREANDSTTFNQGKSFNYDDVFVLANNLSFNLTKDQLRSVNEILDDLSSNKIMYRLLQGDVGSGKTLVAALGLYATFLSGKQGALLAPTEILAKQHYKSLKTLFRPTNVKIEVLYSALSTLKKKDLLDKLVNKEIDILVGTHAILQDNVVFNDLGMVVADEQHRFGVKQREKLREKGDKVDFLLMSATPIPRTLAMILYGDMDISTIETMPKGRKPVKTYLINENSFMSVIDEIEEKLALNEQIYIICAAIEESENFEARNTVDIYNNLKEYFDGRYNVGLLHGKMKSEEKEDVMEEFSKNKIQILISTTVIEVGVNVVNATVMIIYDAHRYGLSQLHQLRGRIQRGNKEGICYLLTDSKDEESLNRLNVLLKSNNGFEISAEDLRLRGPGDILGTRQSGVPGFILGDIFKDTKIINQSRIDAKEIIENKDKPDNNRFIKLIEKESTSYMD
ncbi:MAG: ATP-dependent DNA helicase RecG [Bacillota bacterium]|mgnify:CR=1 FL=1|jgi:ATP-dependent DNA helicase RecG|nr:ATP-dependent DNA helicase RecG [Bacillota bacterium]